MTKEWEEVILTIENEIKKALLILDPKLSVWLREHIVTPKQIELASDPTGSDRNIFVLVTDHTGAQDSSYRVVMDQLSGEFGLECTTESGIQWYMGSYGSLCLAILAM